ncbi:response regulator, partial [Mesorhizobium sp. M8A.F.Ca.ET.181.01.1.1]|uniref:response regulator n=1 Tax=Mesorhizobium sp. M8A.F.Ca.ET.181.01.1.1 TaxID=2563963 RepID=UPI001FE1F243
MTCIISDVQMPGISGLQMYWRLLESGVRLPVVFISAFASDLVRRQALEAGALCVLSEIGEELAQPAYRDERFDPPYSTVQTGVIKGGRALNIVPA